MEQKPPQQPGSPGGPQPSEDKPLTGAAGQAPASADPGSRPATVGGLKGLRRWVIVAGVWAVAASAIGLIALLSQDDGSSDERAKDNERVSKALADLDKRLDRLEPKVNGLATSEEVKQLESQVNQAKDDAAGAGKNADATGKDISEANSRIDDLEKQVEELESSGGSGGDSGGSSP